MNNETDCVSLFKMKTVEIFSEKYFGSCFICRNEEENRINIHYEHITNGKAEKCVTMLNQCYGINVVDVDNNGEMCIDCLSKLENALSFRQLVEEAHSKLSNKSTITEVSNDDYADEDNIVFILTNDNKTEEEDEEKTLPTKIATNETHQLEKDITVCPVCNLEKTTHESLKKHYATHFPKFMCHICGLGMNSQGYYKIHLNTHENIRYSCDQCDKIYKAKSVLRDHIKKHHENISIQKYKCHKCPEKFVNYRTRKKHMFDRHGVACVKFNCHLCDKSYFTQTGHKLHYKKIHLNIKDFICKECDRGFSTHVELNLHMNSHSDVRNFSCDVCGRRFKDKKTLTRHIMVHKKTKQHKCSYCDSRFVHRFNALRHERKQHNTSKLYTEHM